VRPRRPVREAADWRPAALAGAGVLTAASLVAAVAAYRQRYALPAAPPRVAMIGDSYGVGLGPQLAKLLPVFQFEAHGGTNTLQWARHDDACGTCGDWIPAFRPDVTLVVLGVNDGVGANPKNYRTLVEGLRRAGSMVLWVEPPAGVTAPTALARQAIAGLGVPTVPATATPVSADGVHPQRYGPWAAEIARAVAG
jgi:hypothetical protein